MSELEKAARQEIDWKDQYEKQKRRAEMWIAKYEADIGPVEKAGPVAAQQEPWPQEPAGHIAGGVRPARAVKTFHGGKPHYVAEQPAQQECTRSHPHEDMDAMCELRTQIARLTNENARLKAAQQEPTCKQSLTVEQPAVDPCKDGSCTCCWTHLDKQPAIKQGWDVDTLLDKPKQPAIKQSLTTEQPAQNGGCCPTCGAWHDDQIIKQPAQQEVVDSDTKAEAYMEARLWEFIDMAAAFPNASPDPRTWSHVMVYAPKPAQQEPVACSVCDQVHAILDADKSQIIRNAEDGYPEGRLPRVLTLQERVEALCKYAADWKRWCLEEEARSQAREPLTDEQILTIARDHYNPHQRPEVSFARAIEAKLREKNA